MRGLINDIKKTVVFLGKATKEREIRPNATGFLVSIQGIVHLVTTKHTVIECEAGKFTGKSIDKGMRAFFNTKAGKIGTRSLSSIKKKFGVNWIFHENEDVDIALIPFGLDIKKDDVKTIPDKLFLTVGSLFELYDIFFLSYQPGIQLKGKISPVIREGTVSLINNDNTFYIDASAFPGNSGSPVFLKATPIKFTEGTGVTISVGEDPLGGKFIGVIGSYLPYREVAISTQTGNPRVIFEENTGLSLVWSVSFIEEIVESDTFKRQLDKLLKR